MQSKFNFYDFVGYLLPGILLITFIYWLLKGFLVIDLNLELKTIGDSVILIAASYFAGHIVQAIGNTIENQQVKTWGGVFSEQFLREDNNFFSKEFKVLFREYAKESFSLELNTEETDIEVQKKHRQEVFYLCYYLIVQENAALHTEIFNGLYGLYRGILVTNWIGCIVSLTIAWKQIIILLCAYFKLHLNYSGFLNYNNFQLWAGCIIALFLILLMRPLEMRFKRFGQSFAGSVYRNFYVWYKRKTLKPSLQESKLIMPVQDSKLILPDLFKK